MRRSLKSVYVLPKPKPKKKPTPCSPGAASVRGPGQLVAEVSLFEAVTELHVCVTLT